MTKIIGQIVVRQEYTGIKDFSNGLLKLLKDDFNLTRTRFSYLANKVGFIIDEIGEGLTYLLFQEEQNGGNYQLWD